MRTKMKINEILKQAKEEGVFFRVIDNQLKIEAENKPSDSLINLIKEYKKEIILTLSSGIKRVNKDAIIVSKEQQAIWMSQENNEDKSLYNFLVTIDVEKVNEELLDKAFVAILKKHETLRTSISLINNSFVAQVNDVTDTILKISYCKSEAELANKLDSIKNYKFNIEEGKVFSADLIKFNSKTQLCISAHHIAIDGLSFPLIFKELSLAYKNLEEKGESNLLPPEYRYSDIVYNKELVEVDDKFWINHLSGVAPSTRVLERHKDYNAAIKNKPEQIKLSKDISESMRSLASDLGISLFSLLQTAHAISLSLMTGNDSILLGSPLSGRDITESLDVVGCFVRVLPFNCNLKGSIREVLVNNNITLNSVFQNQNTTLNEISELLHSEGQERIEIENSFTFNPSSIINFDINGNRNFSLLDNYNNARYNIELHGFDDERLTFLWVHNAKIDQSVVTQLKAIFIEVIQGISESLDVSVSNFKWKLPSAKETVKTQDTVVSLFKRSLLCNPEKTALISATSRWSYRELDENSDKIAQYILNNSSSEEYVGIALDRDEWSIAAMLGALKAGACYVPIDPRLPNSKIEQILNSAEINLVITNSEYYTEIDALFDKDLLLLDDEYRDGMLPSNINLKVNALTPDLAAYIMFTSGTTGEPKGVKVPQRAISRLALEKDTYRIDSNTIMLHGSVQNFDASTLEIWGALLNGGSVAIYKNNLADIPALNEFLAQYKINTMWMTSGLFDLWIDSEFDAKTLSQIIVGGDIVSPISINKCQTKLPNAKIINGYGPTENTTFTCCFVIDKFIDYNGVIPIGTPINGTQCKVIDPDTLNVLPNGAVGELLALGDGLADEYINNPTATNDKFIEITLSGKKERGYRTGDMVRMNCNGQFEYIGRKDSQIKVRGYRLELDEVSLTLSKNSMINSAYALFDKTNNELRAFLVANDNQDIKISDIRYYAERNLPQHAVPHNFTFIDKIPLNINGKVDKNALLAIKADNTETVSAQPETETEKKMHSIWLDALNIDTCSTLDNFFNIGGDSIRAIKVVSGSKSENINISIKDIFECKNIKTLSRFIDEGKGNNKENTLTNTYEKFSLLNDEEREFVAGLKDISDAYPLSKLQHGMVYHHNIKKEMYHDIMTFTVNEQFDKGQFATSLGLVVLKHDMLRTMLIQDVGRGIQCVKESIDAPLVIVDLKQMVPVEQTNKIKLWKDNILNEGIDVTQIPWGVTIFELSDNEFSFNINFHHAIFDGWSLATLLSELFNNYAKPGELETDFVEPFSTFIGNELESLQNGVPDAFIKEISDESHLPWWHEDVSASGGSKIIPLGKERMSLVDKLSKQYKVQNKVILFAAYSALMSKMNGSRSLITSIVVNGRPEVLGSEKTVGIFINSLPTKTPNTNMSWSNYIEDANNTFIMQQSLKNYPLSAIQESTGLQYDASLFNYVDFHVYETANNAINVGGYDIYEKTNYALQFLFARNPKDNSLILNILSGREYFNDDFLVKLSSDFFDIIDNMFVSDALVNKEELEGINGPALDRTGHFLSNFESSVQLNPNNTAVRDDSGSVTYLELDKKADIIASFMTNELMMDSGVVGIKMSPSIDMLASIIGTWKAGLTYLPIDIDTPVERAKYMLNDSQAYICLVDGNHSEDVAVKAICVDDITSKYSASNPIIKTNNRLGKNAYIIYTSGTTGTPKGVLVSHSAISGYFKHTELEYFSKARKALVSTSINFDATMTSLIAPLAAGATVVCSEDKVTAFSSLAKSESATLFKLTPSMLSSLLAGQKEVVSNTKHIFVLGGEKLLSSLILRVNSIFPNSQCVNEYGPTEASVGTTVEWIDKNYCTKNKEGQVSIGLPISGSSCHILGPDLIPVLGGCRGEIFIEGPMLAEGYLNREEQTKCAFIKVKGKTLYRTGDFAIKADAKGISFLGRKDTQIKHNGIRIELSEIENVIKAFTNSPNVCVVYDENKARIICALVDNKVSIDKIISHINNKLHSYMQPHAWVDIDGLPLTINGKVDSDQIIKIANAADTESSSNNASGNNTQRLLIDYIKELTNYPYVNLDSNITEIGADSLKIMTLLSFINATFGINLKLSELIEHQTVRQLGYLIESELMLDNINNNDSEGELIF
jgi:amino acid adenylation domain-containing protein